MVDGVSVCVECGESFWHIQRDAIRMRERLARLTRFARKGISYARG
jgi:hypothetical protein